MKKNIFYGNIFMYASLQFCGNIEEYFAKHSKRVVVYLVMPRLKNKYNLLRTYENGKKIKEEKVWSSDNIFLYYFSWFFHHNLYLVTRFPLNERLHVIAGHPVSFFGMSIQKLIKKISYTYWIGDYFPGDNKIIKMFESVKRFYHDKVNHTCYLSDEINKVFNGKILNSKVHKTIMWGVKPRKITKKNPKNKLSLLFVGLIKNSQGLDFLLDFLKKNRQYALNIIGICDNGSYETLQKKIQDNNIQNSVFFPNKFYSDDKLFSLSRKCHIGIALYDADKFNPTYYTDPGKVKSYAEYGLPVIMSNVSGIADYVFKYKSGILINRENNALTQALKLMKQDYKTYLKGLKKFNEFFFYESYYKNAFSFLEEL